MKGSLKKALTAVAAGVLAIGMAVSGGAMANAEETAAKANLTIKASDANTTTLEGRTFAAYRVLDAAAGKSDTTPVTVNSKYQTALNTVTGKTTESDILAYINALDNDSKVRKFAEDLRDEINAEQLDADVTINGGDSNSVTTQVDFGWYIIDETTAKTPNSGTDKNAPVSLVKATLANRTVEVDLKGGKPTSEKNIVDNNEGKNPRKVDDYNINDDILYQLNFTIPSYWSTQYKNGFWFTMNDKLSDGLTFDKLDSIKVDGEDYTGYEPIQKVEGTAGAKLTIAFGSADAADASKNLANLDLAGKTISVYYHAHMNENAVIAKTGNPNTYNVTYQRNPYNAADGEDTPEDTPRVYTFQFGIHKVDGDDHDSDWQGDLKGAEFELLASDKTTKINLTQAANGTYQPAKDGNATITTDNKGHAVIAGLDEGTYYLKETKAPAGFMLSNELKEVTITKVGDLPTDGQTFVQYKVNDTSIADANVAYVEIENHKGTLPSTGGMGIVFMVVAGIALIAAGAFSMMRRRA